MSKYFVFILLRHIQFQFLQKHKMVAIWLEFPRSLTNVEYLKHKNLNFWVFGFLIYAVDPLQLLSPCKELPL